MRVRAVAGLISVLADPEVDDHRLGASIAEGIHSCSEWPMSAEVEVLPEPIPVPRSGWTSGRSAWLRNYAVVLRVVCQPGTPDRTELLESARRAVLTHLREVYGAEVRVSVLAARDGQPWSVCWSTLIGNPRFE